MSEDLEFLEGETWEGGPLSFSLSLSLLVFNQGLFSQCFGPDTGPAF